MKNLKQNNTRQNLQHWIDNKVFLIKTVLTVEEKEPLSHAQISWHNVIKKVFRVLDKYVVIFFGKKSQDYVNCFNKAMRLTTCHSEKLPLINSFQILMYWKYFIQNDIQLPF